MRLHPTIVVAFEGTPHRLLPSLECAWQEREGLLRESLEVTRSPEALTRALRALLSQERLLSLRRRGHVVDRAVTLVWLADAHDEHLMSHVNRLPTTLEQADWAGLEVRLHVLLLLPDVAASTPEQWTHAKANVSRLEASETAVPVTRVWPLSLRNQADLYLQHPEDLAPLAQHFVELCVLSDVPLGRVTPNGRDWAALGMCALHAHSAPESELITRLWSSLWPPSNDALPSVALPPDVPDATLPAPDASDDDAHAERAWRDALTTALRAPRQFVDEHLARYDEPLPWEYGRIALQQSPARLADMAARLDHALDVTARQVDAVVDECDRAGGVEGHRARLRRLLARQRRGRAVDDATVTRLTALLADVDSALASHDATWFVTHDDTARRARTQLTVLEERRAALLANLAALGPSTPEPQGCLAFLLRPFTRRQRRARAERERQRDALQRCLRALRRERHEHFGSVARATWQWERTLLRYRVRLAHLEALQHERARLTETQRALRRATERPLSPPAPHPLRLHVTTPDAVPTVEVAAAAEALRHHGLVELLWDGDVDDVHARLAHTAADLRRAHHVNVTAFTEDVWAAAQLAAAPRVAAHDRPGQQVTFAVLGNAAPPPLPGPAWTSPTWFAGEVLLLQVLEPLGPDQLLGLNGGASPSTTAEPNDVPPPAPPSPPSEGASSLIQTLLATR
ncbi:hypothetical protein DES52_11322 [Deinococcus yavapaiensis KR-236]|uniref:Uncharacterized protein n=2 Tax=Deinococcus TaxID=1298 RepID=A0A318S224_9DEIO|nr:hypothetical protein DES52_11322 [Deinococcus yavapaiensis KR-236]